MCANWFRNKHLSLKAMFRDAISSTALCTADFAKDVRGNFAVMFALAAVPVLGFAGLAIEFTRYSMVNEGLKNALDASGLAISQRAAALGYEISDLSSSEKNELKEYGRNFFDANFRATGSIQNLTVDFVFTATTVKPQVSGYMDTSLLKLLDVDSFDMGTNSEVTLMGAGQLELALVLDVTGSMGSSAGGGTRMSALQDAVEDMMDSLYGAASGSENESVKVAVVPFNSVVNTGGTAQMNDAWLDLDAKSMYHGSTFIHIEDPYDIDATAHVNLFELYDSIGSETSWKGCVESRPFPLDEMDTEPGSSVTSTKINAWDDMPSNVDPSVYSDVYDAFNDAPSLPYSAALVGDADNSRFVPYFYPDEPDCSVTSGKDACNYYFSGSSSPGYLYDDINEDGDYESAYYNRTFIRDWQYTNKQHAGQGAFNKYFRVVCQHRYNVAGVSSGGCSSLPLTDDDAWDAIVEKTQATNYGQDEYRLRQAYPGIYKPAQKKYKGKYNKTVYISESGEMASTGPNRYCSSGILPLTTKKDDIMDLVDDLTPGGATNTAVGTIWGWRVLSPEAPFTEGVDTSVETDWRKAIVIMTDGQNSVTRINGSHNSSIFGPYAYPYEDRLNLFGSGSVDHSDMNDELDRKTIRICHKMQAEGIKVYTVGFSISSGSNADKMLKACASVPVGENKTYYLAENADALKDAFQDITEDLVNLHISG